MKPVPAFETLLLEIDVRGVARLTMNRPEAHNALSAQLISELRYASEWLAAESSVRAVVLTGAGQTFCAGGDLAWMQQNIDKPRAQRIAESSQLASMLRSLNELPKPLIGRINGSAYGGGLGMISVCDITVAVEAGVYSLTEARLGLLAANISPYVVARMGEANARRTFLTSHRMKAAEAQRLGLISEVVGADQLDAAIEQELDELLQCAPGAVSATKRLINYVHSHDLQASVNYAIGELADAWESEEGQEGIRAFFARRLPAWRKA